MTELDVKKLQQELEKLKKENAILKKKRNLDLFGKKERGN